MGPLASMAARPLARGRGGACCPTRQAQCQARRTVRPAAAVFYTPLARKVGTMATINESPRTTATRELSEATARLNDAATAVARARQAMERLGELPKPVVGVLADLDDLRDRLWSTTKEIER